MGSINILNIELVDRILKGQVDGVSSALHNACFCVIGNEGVKCTYIGELEELRCRLSTAVTVLIAVEKGLVTLDQNVRDIVPELADLDILEGFDDDGAPRLRKCTAPISLRQLLSHSSGFCYDKQHEGLLRWAAYVGKEENTFTGSYKGYLHPLIFEPGQGWAYGPGMDWAGRTVGSPHTTRSPDNTKVEEAEHYLQIEVVTKQDLESFMRTNIWTPLEMASTTFRPWIRPDLEAKLVEMALRSPDGSVSKAKLLSALLRDGGGIISEGSLNELLRPQTADASHFNSMMCGPKRAHLGQTWPEGSKGHFGLSSSINAENFPGRRAAKSANWQGMPGIHAWLDRTEGLAGLFITQVLPPGDEVVTNCFCALEEAVYQLHVPCTEENKESPV
ncbi:beta-lactamase family protein [Microsporum canis CBS 113480]|uniref:Beta-lactamase family protein n=1 Tax=Arthroderma otae (strain ATCC MYA-4605 / CBS 113480) TaxID=554155 RepID=C5FQT7_ARTOC|nr:beta-lactamase family protein [Microsporum canis CBS 113480]EEQ32240.1 beta-lactamase family protein [Microsporum canis CBS 113480]